MRPVLRRRLADEAAEVFRSWLEGVPEGEDLPSTRRMAEQLGVSVPTLLEVLRRMAAEGRVAPGASRRPYRRVRREEEGEAAAGEKARVLLLHEKPLSGYDFKTRTGVEKIVVEILKNGMELHQRQSSYPGRGRSFRKWEEMLRELRPMRMVVVGGTEEVAGWATKGTVPTLFVGGNPGGHAVPTLGVSLKDRVRVAWERLMEAGHRHICQPMGGLAPDFVEGIRAVAAEALAARGHVMVPTYHMPVAAARRPEVMRAMLEPVFEARVPTAMVFVDWEDCIAVMGFAARRGLVLGREVVVVVLNHEPGLEAYDPVPAYFEVPLRRLVTLTLDWLKHPESVKFRGRGLMLQPFEFREGEAFRGPVTRR